MAMRTAPPKIVSAYTKLAAVLETRLAGQISLFEPEPQIAQVADQAMQHFDFRRARTAEQQAVEQNWTFPPLDINSVAISQFRSFRVLNSSLIPCGNVWTLRQGSQHGASPRRNAPWQRPVVGRLVAPSSDLATWHWLRERTALAELLPEDITGVGKDACVMSSSHPHYCLASLPQVVITRWKLAGA
ncbi:MAG: hypothetical protein ACYCYO_10665 [Bacilli bacterium]